MYELASRISGDVGFIPTSLLRIEVGDKECRCSHDGFVGANEAFGHFVESIGIGQAPFDGPVHVLHGHLYAAEHFLYFELLHLEFGLGSLLHFEPDALAGRPILKSPQAYDEQGRTSYDGYGGAAGQLLRREGFTLEYLHADFCLEGPVVEGAAYVVKMFLLIA